MTGFFIAIEGVDGAGKTTQIRRLADFYTARGREVVVVREPGGTALGEEVRRILLHREEIALHVDTETLLFLSSRVQLYEEVIRPALERGALVISDRYHLSTMVYQGLARGTDPEALRRVLESVLGDRRPQLHLIIDAPLEDCLGRLGDAPDRFEGRPDFLAKVAEGFSQCDGLPDDVVVRVDGSGAEEEVAERVREEVERAL